MKDLLTRVARECFGGSAAFLACPIAPGQGAPEGPSAGAADEGGSRDPLPERSTRNEEASRNPVVQEALDLFRGEITDVKLPGDREDK